MTWFAKSQRTRTSGKKKEAQQAIKAALGNKHRDTIPQEALRRVARAHADVLDATANTQGGRAEAAKHCTRLVLTALLAYVVDNRPCARAEMSFTVVQYAPLDELTEYVRSFLPTGNIAFAEEPEFALHIRQAISVIGLNSPSPSPEATRPSRAVPVAESAADPTPSGTPAMADQLQRAVRRHRTAV